MKVLYSADIYIAMDVGMVVPNIKYSTACWQRQDTMACNNNNMCSNFYVKANGGVGTIPVYRV